MSRRRFLLRLLLIGLLLATGLARAALVAVVLSDASSPYQEFADSLRQEFRSGEHEVQVLDREQAAARPLNEVALVVAVGSQAAQAMAARELRAPVLAAMLPRSTYERLSQQKRDERRLSAVFIDQPPSRHVELLRATLPEAERVGLLTGRDGRDNAQRLAQAARERKLRVQVENIATESDIYPAMQRMFSDGGVLLATPDATVYNAQTVQNILLGAYRMRVPVIGFSPSFVHKAGALAALYSTPSQIGRQCADIARTVLAGGTLPAAQYPRLFTVGVNTYVARAMGLQVEAESVIHERLERLERAP